MLPQVSLPPLDAEPPTSDADDARFDVRREKQMIADEALSVVIRRGGALDEGGGLGESAANDGDGGGGGSGNDPTSLDATVRRMVNAPEDPAVNKYVQMGFPRDAVIMGKGGGGEGENK